MYNHKQSPQHLINELKTVKKRSPKGKAVSFQTKTGKHHTQPTQILCQFHPKQKQQNCARGIKTKSNLINLKKSFNFDKVK